MNLVDLLIILGAAGYAVAGFRNGALAGLLSVAGFVGGAIIGAQIAHPVAAAVTHGNAQVVLALTVLLGCALIGQTLGIFLAARLRAQLTWRPARAVDSTLGAVVSVVGVLVVVWMVALPLASSPVPSLSREIRESKIVHAVDDVMPAPVRRVYASLRDSIVAQSGFPAVFGALQPSRIFGVRAPDQAVTRSAAVVRSRASVVKIVSQSTSCDRGTEGSGFAYAKNRVMTNAHVVAGMTSIAVEVGSVSRTASVVLFDPDRDVAVLSVSGLAVPSLKFDRTAVGSGTSATVAGYPENGPFDAQAARIRDREQIHSENIYGRNGADGKRVSRDIYAIRALVRPGNSGGPLLGRDGRVLGVVFATAIDSSDTGYTLTASEVRSDAVAGRAGQTAVSTGSCP